MKRVCKRKTQTDNFKSENTVTETTGPKAKDGTISQGGRQEKGLMSIQRILTGHT